MTIRMYYFARSLTIASCVFLILALDFRAQAEESGKGSESRVSNQIVPVFYATNRVETGAETGNLDYGQEISLTRFGRVLVQIPPTQQMGKLKRPSLIESVVDLFAEKKENDPFVELITPMSQQEFTEQLIEIKDTQHAEFLIFVHGFNVSFKKAACQCAKLVKDLQFQGTPILFSWPSQARRSKTAYWADGMSMAASVPQFKKLLETLSYNVRPAKMHIFSHSLGGFLVSSGLASLSTEFQTSADPLFDQVIFTAPDIDAEAFCTVIAPQLKQIATRSTVYISSGDFPLGISQKFHGNCQRLGEAYPTVTAIKGIDTVDVSAVNQDSLGHSYHINSPNVIQDMKFVLQGKTPAQRGLRSRKLEQSDAHFWDFHSPSSIKLADYQTSP